MAKIDQFAEKVNQVLEHVDFPKLKENDSKMELAEKFKAAFAETYRGPFVDFNDTIEDGGFALVPALLKNKAGTEYVALLDICVQDSGEHYGTQIIHPEHGVVNQNDFKNILSKSEFEQMFPYKYKPLVKIEGDIHDSSQY